MTEKLSKSIDLTVNRLLSDTYKHVSSREDPTINIVGGQPGSGKSAIKDIIKAKDKNIMIIDGDENRKHHPQYKQIIKESPSLMPQLTQEFSQGVNDKLVKHAIENKKSMVLETTFHSAELTKNIVDKARENGFTADLHFVAVKPEVSRLYTIKRFEDGNDKGSVGRTNAKEIHDDRVKKNIPVLDTVSKEKVFDNINIYKRDVDKNKSVTKLLAKNPPNAAYEVIKERNRTYNPKELKHYSEVVKEIIQLQVKRGETNDNKLNFKQEFKTLMEEKILSKGIGIGKKI
jgi:UDP-N-acetylglucosamine kinase